MAAGRVLRAGIAGAFWFLLVALAFCFIVRLLPGDPAAIRLDALGRTPAAQAALRENWGLDLPLLEQFWLWLRAFVAGDWGRSFRTDQPVRAEFANRATWSAAIGMGGLLLAAIVGFALGFGSALRPRGISDRIGRLLAVLAQAVPPFGLALVVIWLFAVELQWVRPFSGGVLEKLVLPMLLVALYSIGPMARLTAKAFAEVRGSLFHLVALSKGVAPARALWGHGWRHALLVLLAGLTPEFGWVIGGTAVVELVFATPGLSAYVVEAIAARDYPVLQAFLVLVTLWMVAVHFAAALLRRALDPRPAGVAA